MGRNLRIWFAAAVTAASIGASAQDSPESGAHGPSQAAADAIRAFAGTDGAFFTAGLIRGRFDKDNLATLAQFPSDELVVVRLTGGQLRQAFERSAMLFPQPNTSFLQISGFDVTLSRSAPPNQRITSASAQGAPISDSKTYTVVMPSSLGRGGFGYFKIWDKADIIKTYDGVTVESVLKGRRASESSPRWSVSP